MLAERRQRQPSLFRRPSHRADSRPSETHLKSETADIQCQGTRCDDSASASNVHCFPTLAIWIGVQEVELLCWPSDERRCALQVSDKAGSGLQGRTSRAEAESRVATRLGHLTAATAVHPAVRPVGASSRSCGVRWCVPACSRVVHSAYPVHLLTLLFSASCLMCVMSCHATHLMSRVCCRPRGSRSFGVSRSSSGCHAARRGRRGVRLGAGWRLRQRRCQH